MASTVEQLLQKVKEVRSGTTDTAEFESLWSSLQEALREFIDPGASIPTPLREALPYLAVPRIFHRELVERCLRPDLPTGSRFDELVELPDVEELLGPRGRYRVEKNRRLTLLRSWWKAGADQTTVPYKLRAVSRRLADDYADHGDEEERLYHLILVHRSQARVLFRHLFDEADQRFDLPRCHALLRVLEERGQEHKQALGPALERLWREKQVRLDARSLWAPEYYGTIVYFERRATRGLMRRLINGKDYWLLQLYAMGGIGKTMFIRAAIARYCVPCGIPCARIDYDFMAHWRESVTEPWRLLLQIADQLNQQLATRPFDEYVSRYARYMVDVNPRRVDRPRVLAPVEQSDEPNLRQEVVTGFLKTMRDVRQDKPCLVVFDTLEEPRLRGMDLKATFDLFRELHEASPGLRVILSSRYNLGDDTAPGGEPDVQRTGFTEAFPDGQHTVSLLGFGDAEAHEYLEQSRGMAGDPRLQAIIAISGGFPFKLALLADIARDDPELSAEELREYARVDLVYLIKRVVERIRDDLVRWVLRYGSVPRLLTEDFIASVMVPFIEAGIRGDITLDDPNADNVPKQVQAQNLFPRVAGPVDPGRLWQALSQYASSASWVYRAGDVTHALRFHPDVAEPMRYLLLTQEQNQRYIYLRLNHEAAAYFEERARRDSQNKAFWLREAVFHHFHLSDPASAAGFWRKALAAAAGEPQTAKALAEELLALSAPRESIASSGPVQPPVIGADLRALAAYELAYRYLQSNPPLGHGDIKNLKDWLAIAEDPAGRPALHPSQLALLRGRVLLADRHTQEAWNVCRQALQETADRRVELELHLLAADALVRLQHAADADESTQHYLRALELAAEEDPTRVARIAPGLAEDLEARERYEEAAAVRRRVFEASLTGGELDQAAQHLLALVNDTLAMGLADEAVRLGDRGLDALQSEFVKTATTGAPGWEGLVRASIALARRRPGLAINQLSQVPVPLLKGPSGGMTQETTLDWRVQELELRARAEAERLNIREAVATFGKLASGLYPVGRPTIMRANRASAKLLIDEGGDLGQADNFLAAPWEREPLVDTRSGWQAERQLLEIVRLWRSGAREQALARALQLARDVDLTWLPSLRARIALELAVQTGMAIHAVEGLIAALGVVEPAPRRLALLYELRRCAAPQPIPPDLVQRLLALLPDPAAAGQDAQQAMLQLAEVERVVGRPNIAARLLDQVLATAPDALGLVILRELYLARDRLGWAKHVLLDTELLEDDSPLWNEGRELSAVLLLEHAERRVRVISDEQTVGLLERVAQLLGESSPWQPRLLALRAALAFARGESETVDREWRRAVAAFGANEDRQGLGQALEMLLRVPGTTPNADRAWLAETISRLGHVLHAAGELDMAIEALKEAVLLARIGAQSLPSCLNLLGTSLSDRYRQAGRVTDLEEAIGALREAVQSAPPDSFDLAVCLNNLSTNLRDRYEHSGDATDLEEAIGVYRRAIERLRPDSADLPAFLSNLGASLRDRYTLFGDIADIEEAIECFRHAIESMPAGSPDRSMYLNNLGASLLDRYGCSGQEQNLDHAIQYLREAVQFTPPDASSLPGYLSNLGRALLAQYYHNGSIDQIEETIRVYQRAVQLVPPGAVYLPAFLNHLATSLNERYERTGHIEDLEQTLAHLRRAIDTAPASSPDRAAFLSNLGSALRARFTRNHQPSDLDEAIAAYEQAVVLTPPHSPKLPSILNNLGVGLSDRATLAHDVGDLDRAIAHYRHAIDLTSAASPDLPPRLNNLGNALREHYVHTHALTDLEEAIALYRRAVELTSASAPYLPDYLSNLGRGLRNRYSRTRMPQDLNEARAVLRHAVEFTPKDSASFARYQEELLELDRAGGEVISIHRDRIGFQTINVDQRVDTVSGSLVGVKIGPLQYGQTTVRVRQDIDEVDLSVHGIHISKLGGGPNLPESSSPAGPGGELGAALAGPRCTLSIRADLVATWWNVLLIETWADGRTTTRTHEVEVTEKLRSMIECGPREAVGSRFVQSFDLSWREISALLGQAFLPPTLSEALHAETPFILQFELGELPLAWLPWEMLRTDPKAPPLALMPAHPYLLRVPSQSSPTLAIPHAAGLDVLIVRSGEATERRRLRGISVRIGASLGDLYARRDMRVDELWQPDPAALADAVVRLRPRVVHIVAGVRDQGQRVMLDFASTYHSADDNALFSSHDLMRPLYKLDALPLIVLDPPTPPGIYERVRQMCLRNAFAAELVASGRESLAVLATGLGDDKQQRRLTEALIEGVADRLPVGEVARRITLVDRARYPHNVWQQERTMPTLEEILPFVGTALFAANPVLGFDYRRE